MKRFEDDFPTLLEGFSLETLEADPNSIYGLSAELTVNYVNPAWFAFALANGGEPTISEAFSLRTRIADSMSGSARGYYLLGFQTVLRTGLVWHHDYECSSIHKFRMFHQSVYALHNRQGLIIINSLVTERPHDPETQPAHEASVDLYTQTTGLITQCSNCRRVQRAGDTEVWDWVPEWVERVPENTSHSFCRICFDYYYKHRQASEETAA